MILQAPVVHICFMPGKPGTVATADARGVLLLHTLSSVPLLRLISVSTKVATDGRSIGPLLDMRPLMPALPPRGAAHPPPGASTRPDASPGADTPPPCVPAPYTRNHAAVQASTSPTVRYGGMRRWSTQQRYGFRIRQLRRQGCRVVVPL